MTKKLRAPDAFELPQKSWMLASVLPLALRDELKEMETCNRKTQHQLALGHLRHGALERRDLFRIEVLEGLALRDLGPRGASPQREDALVFRYSCLERRVARGLDARGHLPQLARRPAEEPRELGLGEVRVHPPLRVAEPHAQDEAALVL